MHKTCIWLAEGEVLKLRHSAAEISDEQAMERLKQRDPEVLSVLMDAYASSVYGLIGRIMHGIGRQEDVEECVSDTFISVWHRIEAYVPSRGSLRAWIHMIAKYKALDCRRKLFSAGGEAELSDNLAQERDNLERVVLLKSELEEVLKQVDQMKKLDRDIFYRRFFYYESLDTIGERTGLTRKAVENRLRRIRQALRRHMEIEREEGLSWT